jgi:hypothetical protein
MDAMADVSYELFPRLSSLSASDHARVCSAVAEVSRKVVSENPQYWSSLMELDSGEKGAALAFAGDRPVGFWVLERVSVGGHEGLYTVLTNILPEYQGKHIAWQLRVRLLPLETEHDPRPRFYGFLTRNPRAWQLNASLCSVVAPDIFGDARDPQLLDLGVRSAKQLFPDKPLETSSMVMSEVFAPMCCGAKEQHHRTSGIEEAFFSVPGLSDRANARYFIGILKTANELRAMTGGHLPVRQPRAMPLQA